LTRDSLGVRFATLLTEADLVKFARARPDPGVAGEVVRRATALLEEWHTAEASV
jgi:hypothetical protein